MGQEPESAHVVPDHNDHDDDDTITLTFTYCNTPHEIVFPADATIGELPPEIEDLLSIPPSNQKLLVPKLGLLKPPFNNPDLPIASLQNKAIRLLGSKPETVQSVQDASVQAARRQQVISSVSRGTVRKRQRRSGPSGSSTQYTFLQIRPLANLPNSDQAARLLARLKEDPGIRRAMAKHQFSVGLLTEMEPLTNTQVTHEGVSRLLGLNRNRGEVIELRLRTDAHDGFRDYRTIRKTLCHELAHNVHGPHDRDFWDLCHQIEREVDANDYNHGGHTVGGGSYYSGPSEEDELHDDGGWTGGTYVLGGTGTTDSGLSRRDVIRRAAEERQTRAEREREREGGGSAEGDAA
jgi:hypothetical protein